MGRRGYTKAALGSRDPGGPEQLQWVSYQNACCVGWGGTVEEVRDEAGG